jgi:5,6,7,8-tetrahydromethanopterin hydro-lyase
MFGPAQHAVAKAVADSVAEGVIPRDQANSLIFLGRRIVQIVATDLRLGRHTEIRIS